MRAIVPVVILLLTLSAPAGLDVPAAAADSVRLVWPGVIEIVENDGGRLQFRSNEDGRTIKAEGRGSWQLVPAGDDFESVSPGGTFKIEERRLGRVRHRLEVRGLADGTIERRYWKDGDARPFDAEARAWLADAMGVVLWRTPSGALDRVRKVLETSGPEAALAEIEGIGSDHTQGQASGTLLAAQPGDAALAARVAEHAGRTIGSDHQLAVTLVEALEAFPGEAAVQRASVASSRAIGSDHERRRVLQAVVEQDRVSTEVLAAVCESAEHIDSDHEHAELLLALAERHRIDAALAPAFFGTARGIGSDHEKARTLKGVLDQADLPEATLLELLDAAESIGSDHELAGVLVAFAWNSGQDARLHDALRRATRTIGSDAERRRVEEALDDVSS